MARRYTIGFEANHVNFDLSSGAITGAATWSTTNPRSGVYCLQCSSAAGNAVASGAFLGAVLSSLDWFYIRAYIRFDNLPGVTVPVLATNATGTGISARVTSAGKVQLWDDVAGVQIGSDSVATLVANTYYRFELGCQVNSAAGSDDAGELRLDGVTVASFTGRAISASPSFSPFAGWLAAPGANLVMRVDDVAVNDSLGTDQNSWPGAGNVVMLLPTSDNARAALWTGGAGGTTSLFDAVNNTPPAGLVSASATNTSQIEHAGGAAGTTDAYDANMTTYTAAGVPAGATITLVQPVASTGEDIVTGAKLLSFNVKSNPATTSTGAFDVGNGVSAAVGTYPSNWYNKRDAPTSYLPSVVLGTAPVMTMIRPEIATRVASVCFMGVIVEYTPAVAKSPPPIRKRSAHVNLRR
jgi:hypothetical protein